ncbi:MAG: cyclic nucleotide-binding domain-containing protein, partial [Candidatus Cloacimonadota bacterium]|nr:cyclic nucleotide-binding domain-containing protein [Candidatus Cloacimonadota bacterium]
MNVYTRKNDNDLLKYLDEYQIYKIQEIQEIIELNKDKELLIDGDLIRDIYLVYEGAVSIWELSENKKKIKIFDLFEGDTIGENNFITSESHVVCILAKSNAKLVRYPATKLKEIMRKNVNIS